MRLRDALDIVREARRRRGESFSVLLGCGFEALHLATFLSAHLHERVPGRSVEVATGLYGDLAGTLERAGGTGAPAREAGAPAREAAAVVVEWSDLDPRLGVRASGGWSPHALTDVVTTVEKAAARLRTAIDGLAGHCPVVLCAPTLPLPPIATTRGAELSAFESELHAIVAELVAGAVRHARVRVVRAQALDEASPARERLDVSAALRAGFPYRLAHADALAALLAELIAPPPNKKGLITDLDDTLWRGLLGEAGVDGVRWQLADGAQAHALYQQMLAALAESGVLIAVASKNEPALVERALARADLFVRRDHFVPVEAGWGTKSDAVARILRAWNVAADSVVFVDDTPMELAEVAAAHPGIETVRFHTDDPAAVWAMLAQLRDRFGKRAIGDDDRLRAASLRAASAFAADAHATPGGDGFERFLADAQAEIAFDGRLDAGNARALELVNKTNQFSLNGRRYTETEWRALLARPGAFLLRVAYRDRFGPLGSIAVLAGRRDGAALDVDVWAMSCRAFSRRIEHQCLRELVRRFDVGVLRFDDAETGRNGALRALFATLPLTREAGASVLTRAALAAACPPLHHTIREIADD